jgi:hypothetical protein
VLEFGQDQYRRNTGECTIEGIGHCVGIIRSYEGTNLRAARVDVGDATYWRSHNLTASLQQLNEREARAALIAGGVDEQMIGSDDIR